MYRRRTNNNKKKQKKAPNYRGHKQILLGWLCRIDKTDRFKQVRERCGGGTRKIKVPKESNKDYIMKKAIELFFPNGNSKAGTLDDFDIDLLDFKNNELDDHTTVAEMLESTGLRMNVSLILTKMRKKNSIYICKYKILLIHLLITTIIFTIGK